MTRAWLALLSSALLWSTSFAVIRKALGSWPPVPLLTGRFLVAGLLALLLLVFRRRTLAILAQPAVIFLGLINAFGFFAQFQGQVTVTAATASFLINTYVVYVGLLAYPLLKEPLTRIQAISVALAIPGIYLMSREPGTPWGLHFSSGALWILTASWAWAFYILYSRKAVKHLNAEEVALGVMVWTLVPLLVFLPKALPYFRVPAFALTASYLGLFCSLVPYFLYVYGLQRVQAVPASVVLLLEMVLGALWGILFLAERLQPVQWLGALLLLGAVVLQMVAVQES